MLLRKGSNGNEVKALQGALHLFVDGVFGKLTEEAVKEFQRTNGLKPDGIVGDKTWAKLFPSGESTLTKSRRVINEIIVHCSATREGKDYTVADVKRWHTTPVSKGGRGWSDIGYHYVIHRDGTVHKGRDVNVSGAHCTGHNSHSIGVCYIGGCEASDGRTPKDTRTQAQKKSLLELLQELKKLYPRARIRGHRDFANKACPSFDATKEYSKL